VQEVGKSVVMCAITTIIGFGSLMTMRFNGVASLGLVISIGVIFCLFTAIVLLPALLHFLKD
jgi:predicted RND superfamily exporter protein